VARQGEQRVARNSDPDLRHARRLIGLIIPEAVARLAPSGLKATPQIAGWLDLERSSLSVAASSDARYAVGATSRNEGAVWLRRRRGAAVRRVDAPQLRTGRRVPDAAVPSPAALATAFPSG